MANSARINQLREFLNSEPDDIFLNYALGIEYVSFEETYDMAEVQFKKVLKLNPDYIASYYQLGKLYELLSKNEQALQQYKIGLDKAKEQKNNKAINEFAEAVFMLED